MADGPSNVYTEDQHFALLTSAVERETASITAARTELEAQVASLTEDKAGVDAQLAEANGRLDVLEAEKVNAEAAAAAAVKALDDFKAELAEKAQVETRKADRIAAVKAANSNLPDDYFSEARVQRWAEMADEQFTALVADMTESLAAASTTKAAAAEDVTSTARESAAFTGGTDASTQKATAFAQYLAARRGTH